MSVQRLQDVSGYYKLATQDKIIFALSLHRYLESLENFDNRNLDILGVKKGKKIKGIGKNYILSMIEDDTKEWKQTIYLDGDNLFVE